MKTETNFFAKAGPLLLVLFIDGMGLGLVFPILNALIIDSQSGFLAHSLNPTMHGLIYGSIIGIFMLCWFFGAAILGDLSDQIGRKKALMICLLGTFLGYILSAVAVILHSLTLLILGRIIAGFTSGSQPIAQAAIIDMSSPEHKTRNIGLVLLALSLGFIVGPLLGGVLSDKSLVHWFNFTIPFYFVAVTSLLNIGLLKWLFDETFTQQGKIKIKIHHAIEIFISAFTDKKVRNLSFVLFIFILGWSSYYSFISMFLFKTYGFSATKVSIFMAVMGIGFGVGNGILVNYFTRRFSLNNNVIVFMLISALITLIMIAIPHAIFSWLLIAPLACSVSITYSALLTLFSNQVDADSQGWVMGITGAILALVWGVDAIVVGVLTSWDIKLPMIIAVVCLVLAAGLMTFLYKSKPSVNANELARE